MKINITAKDYTWHGLGGNYYNFIENVTPRISKWLIEEYTKSKRDYSPEEIRSIAKKLYRIAEIIDEEINE